MNFYNPYYYIQPSNLIQPKIGLLGRLFGSSGISISNFLNGTQKVLNIANQTIPLVKQIKPLVGNAKTMFKIMNEFKKTENPIIQNKQKTNEEKINNVQNIDNIESINSGPQFFI